MAQRDVLIGELTPKVCLIGELTSTAQLFGTLAVGYRNKIAELPAYEGTYAVTSKAHEVQILETKNKRMTDDMTVCEIPYWETSNTSGGATAYIGSEVKING